jgi:hypothetical protein
MPVLLAFTWRLLQGGKEWRQGWWVVALLVTGLFYLHFRVFLLYLPFVPLAWMANRGRQTGRLLLAALLAALLTGPRLIQLLQITEPENSFNGKLTNYNDFPFSYVQTGWEQLFLGLAAGGFLVSLAAWRKRKPWAALPLTLVGWTAVLIILLAVGAARDNPHQFEQHVHHVVCPPGHFPGCRHWPHLALAAAAPPGLANTCLCAAGRRTGLNDRLRHPAADHHFERTDDFGANGRSGGLAMG